MASGWPRGGLRRHDTTLETSWRLHVTTDLLRKALEGSTTSSGYKVSMERLKIHSVQVQGDALVVDADGDIRMQ